MESLLYQLNLVKGSVYEVIVSAYKGEGKITAAPIGITAQDTMFRLQIFTKGSLLEGLEYSKCGVVNFTIDPLIFYRTAFKEKNPRGKLPKDLFEAAHSIKAPRLKSSNAFIEFTVDSINYGSEGRSIIFCQPVYVEKVKMAFQPYNRGLFASIESIVHATRIRKYLMEGRLREAEKLIELVEYYGRLVERVAPNTTAYKIIDKILDDIKEWRASL